MSQTKAQLVGGVGLSTVGNLSVYGGINATGVITASSFVGNLTGNSTGLTGTPNLNVGVITATSATFTGTSAVGLTTGTTSERPDLPNAGMIRYNSETQSFEGYTTDWGSIGGGGGASGSNGNEVFYENDTNVTSSYTITSGKNAMSAGPITLDSGVVVTIPSGSVWTVV
jgi:hypothetical protein